MHLELIWGTDKDDKPSVFDSKGDKSKKKEETDAWDIPTFLRRKKK